MALSLKNKSETRPQAGFDESPLAVHRRQAVQVKKPKSVHQGFWGFLLVAVVGGFFLYAAKLQPEWAPEFVYYDYGRWILFASLWILVIMDAFQNNILSGLVSILVPPYTVVQGIIYADSATLRGMVLAFVGIFVAEYFLIGDQSMALAVQQGVNALINEGHRLLSREDW